MATPGLFVTFEGMDGCGKTTQIERLADWLRQQGRQVLLTRNPGGTELGQAIRNLVLHTAEVTQAPVNPWAELMLYMADRAQHTQQVVLPALAQGQIVLCDRHMDSTLAYQGYGRGIDLAMIRQLNDLACQGCLPDVTILLDGPLEVLLARVTNRGKVDRLESEALAFKQRVQQGFLDLVAAEPTRIRTFDATKTQDEVAKSLQHFFAERLMG
jgi:dTMP kinase